MCQGIAHKKFFLLQQLAEAVFSSIFQNMQSLRDYIQPFCDLVQFRDVYKSFYNDSLEQNGKQVRIIGRYAGIIGRTMSIKE